MSNKADGGKTLNERKLYITLTCKYLKRFCYLENKPKKTERRKRRLLVRS